MSPVPARRRSPLAARPPRAGRCPPGLGGHPATAPASPAGRQGEVRSPGPRPASGSRPSDLLGVTGSRELGAVGWRAGGRSPGSWINFSAPSCFGGSEGYYRIPVAGRKADLSRGPEQVPSLSPHCASSLTLLAPPHGCDRRRDRSGKGPGAVPCPEPSCGARCGNRAAGWGRAPRAGAVPWGTPPPPSPVAPITCGSAPPSRSGSAARPGPRGVRFAPSPPSWLPGSPGRRHFQTLPGSCSDSNLNLFFHLCLGGPRGVAPGAGFWGE